VLMTAYPVKLQDLLHNSPQFVELAKKDLARLAAATSRVRAPAGTVLFRRGEPCAGIYVIVYGQVKLAVHGNDGAEKILEILGAGQTFGEPLMFLDEPHMSFAETLADSLLLLVGKAAVLQTVSGNPRFAQAMLASMAQRLQRVFTDIEAYTLKSGSQRVVEYLLREVPGDVHDALDVRLPAAKSVVASRLSITREHFSRVLHDLTHAGLIGVSGRVIHIADPSRLRAWVG
jgi:CRP/FNR family transcriptional regulator, dissimilatory nitrate respiration regulator